MDGGGDRGSSVSPPRSEFSTTTGKTNNRRTARNNNRASSVAKNTPLKLEDVLNELPDGFDKKDYLVKDTVTVIMRHFATGNGAASKKTLMAESVQQITYAERTVLEETASGRDHTAAKLPPNRAVPNISITAFMFCAVRIKECGFDYDHVRLREEDQVYTLLYALNPNYDRRPYSLDTVLRQALKELTADVNNEYDADGQLTVDNPVVICGTYLELALLQKIRKIYKKRFPEEDSVTFFTRPVVSQRELSLLVRGSRSEHYVRLLHDRHAVKAADFETKTSQRLGCSKTMRVWTNRRCQTATNIAIGDHLRAVYDFVVSRPPPDERRADVLETFAKEYGRGVKEMVRRNHDLVSRLVKSSELMCWMCLGVTLDDDEQGCGAFNTAISYFLLKEEDDFDKADPSVCWNYVLASLCPRNVSSDGGMKLDLVKPDYWNFASTSTHNQTAPGVDALDTAPADYPISHPSPHRDRQQYRHHHQQHPSTVGPARVMHGGGATVPSATGSEPYL